MHEAVEGSRRGMNGAGCGTLKRYDNKSTFVLESRIVLFLLDPGCVVQFG